MISCSIFVKFNAILWLRNRYYSALHLRVRPWLNTEEYACERAHAGFSGISLSVDFMQNGRTSESCSSWFPWLHFFVCETFYFLTISWHMKFEWQPFCLHCNTPKRLLNLHTASDGRSMPLLFTSSAEKTKQLPVKLFPLRHLKVPVSLYQSTCLITLWRVTRRNRATRYKSNEN